MGITSYSFAQFGPVDNNTELPEVMVQLILRDSNGTLISYTEGVTIQGIGHFELNRYLDKVQDLTVREVFFIDDNKYESQQFKHPDITYDAKNVFSTTRLNDIHQNEFVSLLDMRHDSFQARPGDTLNIFWTIIRSVD